MPSENCSPTLYATSSTLSASWSAEGRDVLMLQFLATLLQGLARGQGLNAEGVARSWCLSARCLGYSKRMATTGPRREARRERRSPAVAVGRATGRAILALLLALCWLAFGCSGPADTVPSPTSWVTDNAGFLSEKTREAINVKLKAYEARTGHQVLVWVGESTRGEPVERFATRTFNAWGVGRKGLDDGLVIFLFAKDHTIRIEVGLGFEAKVTNAIATRILQEIIVPRLAAGDHDGAVIAGAGATLRFIDGASWTDVEKEFGASAPSSHR